MSAVLLAQFLVKGAVVLLAAWVLTHAMRRSSAASRHLIWTVGIVAVLALPVVPVVGPTWMVVMPESWSAATATAAEPAPLSPPVQDVSIPLTPASDLAPAAASATPANEAQAVPDGTTPERESAERVGVGRLIAMIWLAGVLLLLTRLAYGIRRAHRMTRDASPVTDPGWLSSFDEAAAALRIDRRVRLRQSERTTVPVACGFWRPSVLLPAGALSWTPDRRLVVLLHELAHVRRRDCLVQTLAHLMWAVHWMNPLAHVALGRVRAEQERACDDLVLEAGADAPQYADHLFEIARSFRQPSAPAWATLAMARPSQLEGRLMAILDEGCYRRPLARRMRYVLGAGAVAALVALGALRITAAEPSVSDAPAMATLAVHPDAATVGDSRGPAATLAPERAAAAGRSDAGPYVAPRAIEDRIHSRSEPAAGPSPEAKPVAGLLPAMFTLIGASMQQPPSPASPPSRQQRQAVSDETRRRVADALATALTDENADVREQALNSLAAMRDSRAIPALLKALGDPSAELRERAVSGLAQFDTAEANDALLSALKDTSPDVREHAARHLGARMGRGQLQEQKYVDAFLALLKDPVADVREQAAMMAGRSRNSAAVPALLPLLKDTSVDVRERAAQALGLIADPAAIDALTAALKDASPDVREQAAIALGQIARGQRRDNRFGPIPPVPPVPPRPVVKLDADAIAKMAEVGATEGMREAARALRNLDLNDLDKTFDKTFDKDFEKRIEQSIESALESLKR